MTHPLSGGCAPATMHISGEKVFVLEFGRVRASDVIHGRVSVLQEGAPAVTYYFVLYRTMFVYKFATRNRHFADLFLIRNGKGIWIVWLEMTSRVESARSCDSC